MGLAWNKACEATKYQNRWCRIVAALCVTRAEEDEGH